MRPGAVVVVDRDTLHWTELGSRVYHCTGPWEEYAVFLGTCVGIRGVHGGTHAGCHDRVLTARGITWILSGRIRRVRK